MSMTQSQIQARLNAYLEAEQAILKNQSYTIGTRTYTRANLKWIQEEIPKLRKELQAISGTGSMRTRRIVMRDD